VSEANKTTARKFIESMGRNDSAAMAECLAEDAWADAKGYGKLSGKRDAGVMVGMLDELAKILPTGLRFEIVNLFGEGDRVALEAQGNAVTKDGQDYRNRYAFLFKFEDGKIKEINEYFCGVHADEVLWPLVEAAGI
jgi:ketosteroid isomerase-like protein